MTLRFRLSSGDVVPFSQGEVREEANRKTHIWTEVDAGPQPSIPKEWAEATGIYEFPKTTLACVVCGCKWGEESAKYECGRPERYSEGVVGMSYSGYPYSPPCRRWTQEDIS